MSKKFRKLQRDCRHEFGEPELTTFSDGTIHRKIVCKKCTARRYIPRDGAVKKKEKSKIDLEVFRKKQKYGNNFYTSKEWIELRYRVLSHYGAECMLCGATKVSMHVDHIKPRSKFPELALTFENLQVLCKNCNMGKQALEARDFRPKILVSTAIDRIYELS